MPDLEDGAVVRKRSKRLPYRSDVLKEELIGCDIRLTAETAYKQASIGYQVEVCLEALKEVFGRDQTLATTLVALVISALTKT